MLLQSVLLCPFDSLSASSGKPTGIKIGSRKEQETSFLPGYILETTHHRLKQLPSVSVTAVHIWRTGRLFPSKPHTLPTLDLSHIRNMANTPMGGMGAVLGTATLTSPELSWPAEEGASESSKETLTHRNQWKHEKSSQLLSKGPS